METIKIHKRFCGPPNSANGGYVCGLLAARGKGVSEVTLLKPPPLERELIIKANDGKLILIDGEVIIAEAIPSKLEMEIPDPPTFEDTIKYAKNYKGFNGNHIFPTCFVCGPDREEGDGLRIFAGTNPDKYLVAAPWIPHKNLSDNGNVPVEILWSTLDCPGYFAFNTRESRPMVLGRMTGEIKEEVKIGEKMMVVGWEIGYSGRKSISGTALFRENGNCIGNALSVWIEFKEDQF